MTVAELWKAFCDNATTQHTYLLSLILPFAVYLLYVYYTQQRRRTYILNKLNKAVIENDFITCITLLKRNKGLVNAHLRDGYTPFLKACLYGHTQIVKYMIDFCDADVNKKTPKKESAIYLATFDRIKNMKSRDASCLHTLYYANVDINEKNSNGHTALHLAALFGHTPLVRWLLSKGASTNIIPSPYVLARSQGHLETAMVLKNSDLKAIE